MKTKLTLLIACLALLSFNLFSIEIKSSEIRTDESGSYEGDYLYYGQGLNFEGVADDVYFIGKEFNFEGESKSGVVAIGENIATSGTIGNDMIALGDRIDIDGVVDGTTFLGGDYVIINNDAEIKGTLFAAGSTVEILGVVNGDIYAVGGILIINGTVNGDIKAAGGKLIMGDNGQVTGKIEYHSDNKMPEELAAYSNLNYIREKHGFDKSGMIFFKIMFLLAGLFTFMIGGFILLLLPAMRGVTNDIRDGRQTGILALWGLIPLFAYPALVLVLGVTVIGLPLALLLIAAVFPLAFAAQVIGVVLTGQFIFDKLSWDCERRFLIFLIGGSVYLVISLIPFIGCLFQGFITALGAGFLIEKVFDKKLV